MSPLKHTTRFIVTWRNHCLWSSQSVLSLEVWFCKWKLDFDKLTSPTVPLSWLWPEVSTLSLGGTLTAFFNFGEEIEKKKKNLISFLGKRHHCARDVLPLLGAFSCLFVFQKGFGSQLSCQGAPEFNQGSLKAGGQRSLTLPCSEWLEGAGVNFLFCRLITY